MPDRLTQLDRAEVLRHLGDENPDASTAALLEDGIKTILELVRPGAIYRYLNVQADEHGALRLKGAQLPLQGEGVRALLEHCQSCALLATSIGPEPVHAIQEESDPTRRAMLAACAAAAAGQVGASLEQQIRGEAKRQGMYATTRFSSGAAGFSGALSTEICELLDASRRLHVEPAYVFAAMMGLSDRRGAAMDSCEGCPIRTRCSFLSAGICCREEQLG